MQPKSNVWSIFKDILLLQMPSASITGFFDVLCFALFLNCLKGVAVCIPPSLSIQAEDMSWDMKGNRKEGETTEFILIFFQLYEDRACEP